MLRLGDSLGASLHIFCGDHDHDWPTRFRLIAMTSQAFLESEGRSILCTTTHGRSLEKEGATEAKVHRSQSLSYEVFWLGVSPPHA